MDFSEFNKKINAKELQKEIDNVAKENGNGDYPDVKNGEYIVKLNKMEVGACGENAKNAGAPLLKADFKIIEGEFKKSHIFLNKVLYTDRTDDKWNMAKLMANVLGWLRKLEPSEEVGDIVFEDYDQFSYLILDIAEDIESLEYKVEYDADGFNSIKVLEVYD